MGISREQAAENREAIVAAAERLFREHGVDAVGLTALMKAAGFTQGGFYNHFKSKDALVAAVMSRAVAASNGLLAGGDAAAEAVLSPTARVERYLSMAHRDDVACGCPMAGFAGDAPRIGDEAQAWYAKGLADMIERMTQAGIEQGLSRAHANRAAMARFAQMVGTLVLSRAVVSADPALSEALLAAGRDALNGRDTDGVK
ncbi:TetR family transcriptional regulator [Pandoraea sp. XJJ-1]|uniref:HTH-type transcriptional repressor BepR n=1 Tax=Pandoraea cepalis TaxID=2508294 RepID=A0A5E4TQV6_9BURK|nr:MULTISPECIES: TetR/AcrR family transcriptional regulator [Pandoraea]MBN9114081.1 TetR/AcrR family transcriptional regulator [Pandoraea sp.]OJY23156.1 MAG: TetR family transcriptional regulator [Pandoraea sp. 64-18]WAL80849.1 TetR family transcriptional regulator [Pandoraea sp. XJJ-1]VVD89523.1 HTH-type transcriptional repressor BepR [Pandoraea cepalis]BDD93984.1 TetR family transcriptional regulator [Pandoraea sp. NE5]